MNDYCEVCHNGAFVGRPPDQCEECGRTRVGGLPATNCSGSVPGPSMPALGPHELSKSEAQQKVRELMKEIHHLKAMELAHRTMCRAAANEILREWDAHCDEEGYGPCNLVARLNGKSPPDLYPAYATEAEHNQWIAWRHGQNTPAQPPQVG